MNSTTLTALVSFLGVLAVGVLVPIFLVGHAEKLRREDNARSDKLHREDREAEWARQDAVAARAAQAAEDLATSQKAIAAQAAEAATLLLARQEESAEAQREVARQAAEAARLLAANNELVAASAKDTGRKLDDIHTLVNSTLTHAMQSELEAIGRELAMMREVMELRRAGGQEPGAETLAAIEATEAKLHELEAVLSDRAKAQAKVDNKNTPGMDVITTTRYRAQGAGESGA